jgi:hypothetical protein
MSQSDFYPTELALAKAGERLRREVEKYTGLTGWKELSNSDRNRASQVFRDLALKQYVKTLAEGLDPDQKWSGLSYAPVV